MSRVKTIGSLTVLSLVFLGVLVAMAQTAQKPPTELYVRTTPPGAKVFVDGKEVGNSPSLLEVEPGDHTVTVKLDSHQPRTRKVTIREGRIRRVILALRKAPQAGGVAWGKAVEGVQFRVRCDRQRWHVDQTIAWKIDVRNTGKRHLTFAPHAYETVKIDVDGRVFSLPATHNAARSYELRPGQEQTNIDFRVSRRWQLKDHPFQLEPGKHTVKITLGVGPAKGERGGWLQVTSNPVEIEITSAEVRPKAPDQEPAWGKQVENLQCRIRAEKAAWTAAAVPKLFGDLRSYDTWHPDPSSASENWEIEIDGMWHQNQRAKLLRSHRYKLLRISANSTEHDVREVVYQLAIDAEQTAARSLRALAPGKHVLRAGYRFGAFPPDTAKVMSALQKTMGPHRFSRSGKAVHVVSNPIEIEILPAKPTTAPGASSPPKLSPRKLFSTSHGADAGILGVAFSPDGLTVAAVDEQGKITLCDARSGGQRWGRAVLTPEEKKLLLYEDRKGRIHTASIAYSPDGYTLAVAADPVVRLYDAQSGRLLRTLHDKQLVEQLKALKRPPATVSRETELLEAVPHAHGRAYSVAFSPDGKLLATSGSHLIRADGSSVISAEVATPGKLKLWDAKTGELKKDLGEHFGAVRSVAFSGDGKTLASIGCHRPSWSRSVRLWDPQTGAVKSVLPIARGGGPEGPVAFSPDGKLVAAGALVSEADPGRLERSQRVCKLLVWNAGTGDLLLSHCMPGRVTSLSFSADGKTLATGVGGQGVTLWDSETLTQRVQIQPSTDSPREVQVAFSPTGNLLAVGAKNDKHGFVTVWAISEPGDHAATGPKG